MKNLNSFIIALVLALTPSIALAETAENLMGLGLPPALATALGDDTGASTRSTLLFGSATSLIATNTADGADSKSLTLSGGGGAGNSRGATVFLYGNEHGEAGNAYYDSGNSTNGHVIFRPKGTEAARFDGSTKDLLMNATSGGNVIIARAGKGLQIKEGSNARMDSFALVAGSKVVSNTSVTATTRILCTSNADGGTPGWLRVSARSASTSYTVTSSSGTDTSTVACVLVEPAA